MKREEDAGWNDRVGLWGRGLKVALVCSWRRNARRQDSRVRRRGKGRHDSRGRRCDIGRHGSRGSKFFGHGHQTCSRDSRGRKGGRRLCVLKGEVSSLDRVTRHAIVTRGGGGGGATTVSAQRRRKRNSKLGFWCMWVNEWLFDRNGLLGLGCLLAKQNAQLHSHHLQLKWIQISSWTLGIKLVKSAD